MVPSSLNSSLPRRLFTDICNLLLHSESILSLGAHLIIFGYFIGLPSQKEYYHNIHPDCAAPCSSNIFLVVRAFFLVHITISVCTTIDPPIYITFLVPFYPLLPLGFSPFNPFYPLLYNQLHSVLQKTNPILTQPKIFLIKFTTINSIIQSY